MTTAVGWSLGIDDLWHLADAQHRSGCQAKLKSRLVEEAPLDVESVCPKCDAILDESHAEAERFLREHGYPQDTPGRGWLEERLANAGRRLMQLSAMNAPPVILNNERALIARIEGWIDAWDREHNSGAPP